MIVGEAHGTIALVVADPGSEGAVHWDLQVVGAQPVAVGVRVGEEAALHITQTHTSVSTNNDDE